MAKSKTRGRKSARPTIENRAGKVSPPRKKSRPRKPVGTGDPPPGGCDCFTDPCKNTTDEAVLVCKGGKVERLAPPNNDATLRWDNTTKKLVWATV